MTSDTLDDDVARTLTVHAAALAEGGRGRPALPPGVARLTAVWQIEGAVAIDAVVGRGRLAAAMADATGELREGRWEAFRARAATFGTLDPGDVLARRPPGALRPLVASLPDGDRLAYRSVVATTELGRFRDAAPVVDRATAAAMRALGGAVVANARGCVPLACALLCFGSLAMRDWAEARDHARAEGLAGW